MFSDYRAFGELPLEVVTDGATLSPQRTTGHMTLNVLADSVLTNVTFKYPATGNVGPFSLSLKAGAQLIGIKTASLTTGSIQVVHVA